MAKPQQIRYRCNQKNQILNKDCRNCFKSYKPHVKTSLYCSSKCQHEYQYKQYINRWLSGKENGAKGWNQVSNHIRRWLFEKHQEKCSQCGWNTKHPVDEKCPLEVDHIDGNYHNNRPENLRLLCPNCHSLTPTYKARNHGNGRHARRERYKRGQSY